MNARWLVTLVVVTPMSALAHPPCSEPTAVVGRTACSRFGSSWATPAWMPSVFVELGVVSRRTRTVSPSVVQPDGSSARAIAGEPAPLDTFGSEMRFGIDISQHFYAAAHFDVGIARVDGAAAVGLATGVRMTRGRLAAGAELVGGGRWYLLGQEYDSTGHPDGFSEVVGGAMLDARVRGDVWLLPWLQLGAWLGTSVLHDDDRSGGITLTLATRTFRGR